MASGELNLRGFRVFSGALSAEAQAALVAELRDVVVAAPLFTPVTPSGRPMRVRMTSAGHYGWISDASGYRYAARHPNGAAWPAVPDGALRLWRTHVSAQRMPDCCLINFYGEGAKMGLHQDRDEANFSWPVLSISLGDDGLLRVGGTERGGKTASHWLRSGDAVVMGGAARLAYHGVDRIRFGSSTLLPKGGRINLTLRVVD